MHENTQQLGSRNTYTPWDAAPVPGSVAGRLNRSERVASVSSCVKTLPKTLPNNSEEHITDLSMSGVLSRLARVKLLMPSRGKKAIIERARWRIEEVRRAISPRAEARGLLARER